LDLFLEAGDQFAVGGDQRLLGFDLGRLTQGELSPASASRVDTVLINRESWV
jgi:hypothetical protein